MHTKKTPQSHLFLSYVLDFCYKYMNKKVLMSESDTGSALMKIPGERWSLLKTEFNLCR